MLNHPYIDAYIEKSKNEQNVFNKKRLQLFELIKKEILQRDDLYYFNTEQIDDYVNFAETWYFELDDWEKFLVPFIFMYRHDDDDVVFREFIIIIGRGAGKNGFISTLCHYLISSLHGVHAYDITLVANSERQAKTSFNDIRLTINKKGNEVLNANPSTEYKEEFARKYGREMGPDDLGEFEGFKSRITSLETQSEIVYVASNSSTLDGGREGAIIYDEFHEMEDSSIPDVLSGGLGKTEYGRQIYIGTKGFVRGGHFDAKYNRAESILNGDEQLNGIFPFVCEIDHIDEMNDETLWMKANPALEEPLTKRGKRLKGVMRDEYTELNYQPSGRNNFVTKRMNFIEGDLEVSVATREELMATDREPFDTSDLTPIGGFDYGSVRDFASCGLLFKKGEEYYFLQHSFVIKNFVDKHYGYSNTSNTTGSGKKAPIKQWEQMGLLSVIDEPSLDPRHIVNWYVKAREKHGVNKIIGDNYKMDLLLPLFEAEGFEVEVIRRPQAIHPLLAPRIEDAFANKRIIFGDNPMMRWYTNNVFVKQTARGKIFDKKEEVKRKTDGFHAFVHAMYRANELDDSHDLNKDLEMLEAIW